MKSDEAIHVPDEKPNYDDKNVRSSLSDPEYGEGEAIETTKRGLKARHAQMIALGGTIGMFTCSVSKHIFS
jgi:amino acid transporter